GTRHSTTDATPPSRLRRSAPTLIIGLSVIPVSPACPLTTAVGSPRMSWQALEAIVRDGQSALAMPGLAEQVRRVQEAATPEERTRALATVADTIMATGDSTPWIVYLAAAENPVARHLAVLLAGRSIGSLPEEAMAAIRPLLRDRAIPEDAILAATLGL